VSNTKKTKKQKKRRKNKTRPGAKISLSSFQIQLDLFLTIFAIDFKGFRSGSFRILENDNKKTNN
jgi:hypothetical protein